MVAPAASAGGFDVQDVSFGEALGAFSGYLHLFGVAGFENPGSAGGAFFAALQSIGAKFSTLGQQRHLGFGQHLNFADKSVAASKFSCAARSITERVTPHAQRVG